MVRQWRVGPAIVCLVALAAGCGATLRDLPVANPRVVEADLDVIEPGERPPSSEPTPAVVGDVAATPTPTPPEPSAEAELMPLTGLVVESTRAQRPAIAVRIDAARDAHPQRGLIEADVVIENLVEGGLSRLLAVYHTAVPSSVGPVRSARSTDVDLLGSFGQPGFGYWSANDGVTAELVQAEQAGLFVDVGIDAFPAPYAREPIDGRATEQTGFVFAEQLDLVLDGAPPEPLFFYRTVEREPALDPSPGLVIDWGALQDVNWVWTGDVWARSVWGGPHLDESGRVVGAANVVVLVTEYGISDADPTSPQAFSVGGGDALIFTDGGLIEGTWVRPNPAAPWTLINETGAPILLTPGKTWVELVPADAASVIDPGRVPGLLAAIAEFEVG